MRKDHFSVADVAVLHTMTLHAKTLDEYFNTRDIAQTFDLAKGIGSFAFQVTYSKETGQFTRTWSPQSSTATAQELLPLLAKAIAGGRATLANVKENISKEALSGLYAALQQEMSNLPPYRSSDVSETKTWLNIATTLGEPGRFPVELLKTATTQQKLSMQEALSKKFRDLQQQEHTQSEQAAVVRTFTRLRCAITPSELVSAEEKNTLKRFISEACENESLVAAYLNWLRLSDKEKEDAFQAIIDLHARLFGYADDKPTLKLKELDRTDPDLAGDSSAARNRVRIFAKHSNFSNNAFTFNTILHELTHILQHKLVARMATHEPNLENPEDVRVSFFDEKLVESFGISQNPNLLKIGLSHEENEKIYRGGPDEMHARLEAAYIVKRFTELVSPFKIADKGSDESSNEISDESAEESTEESSDESSNESSKPTESGKEKGE